MKTIRKKQMFEYRFGKKLLYLHTTIRTRTEVRIEISSVL